MCTSCNIKRSIRIKNITEKNKYNFSKSGNIQIHQLKTISIVITLTGLLIMFRLNATSIKISFPFGLLKS